MWRWSKPTPLAHRFPWPQFSFLGLRPRPPSAPFSVCPLSIAVGRSFPVAALSLFPSVLYFSKRDRCVVRC